MKDIILITEESYKAGREASYEYLYGIDHNGSCVLCRDITKAKRFHSEQDVRDIGIRTSYILVEYDGCSLNVVGYPL